MAPETLISSKCINALVSETAWWAPSADDLWIKSKRVSQQDNGKIICCALTCADVNTVHYVCAVNFSAHTREYLTRMSADSEAKERKERPTGPDWVMMEEMNIGLTLAKPSPSTHTGCWKPKGLKWFIIIFILFFLFCCNMISRWKNVENSKVKCLHLVGKFAH